MSIVTRRKLLVAGGASILGSSAIGKTADLTCAPGEFRKFSFTPGEVDTCVAHSPAVQALIELADGEPEPVPPEQVDDWNLSNQHSAAEQTKATTKLNEPVVTTQAPSTSPTPQARPREFARVVQAVRSKMAKKPVVKQVVQARAPNPKAPAVRTHPTKGVRYIYATSRFDGKTHRVPYFADGKYIDDNHNDVNRLLCDWRTGHTTDIKRGVLDFQWQLHQQLEIDEPWFIISGFRSPQTNSALRAKSNGGVAKQSLHMVGMALDLRLKGRTAVQIFRVAHAIGVGGAAPYSKSDFTHIDCGRRRTWGEGLRYV